jgi:putative radical SAM enzyme (TIGR03279 family)
MKLSTAGLRVRFVKPGSPAYKAGLRKGDSIISVGGERIADELEFGFFSAQPRTTIEIMRKNVKIPCAMLRPSNTATGVLFREVPVMRCSNRCIFCFVDQMPPGLRKRLYIKDEDYRHSFTSGNYLTLSRTPWPRLQRIAELGLSPLYLSVHATNREIRCRMLGNSRIFNIMPQLRFLERHAVRFHTQIVVCPGINDGPVLRKTIRDLLSLSDGLLSIAVVPVGLTRYRTLPLVPVGEREALSICHEVARIQDRYESARGRRRIFCADELFIKANLPIPPDKYYEDYPQIGNGVGLVRQLLEEWRVTKRRLIHCAEDGKTIGPRRVKRRSLVVTSQSAFLFIRKIVDEFQMLSAADAIDVAVVRNCFFGETVTVAGLMTAHDVIRTVRAVGPGYYGVFLPGVMFNTYGYTLDGYSKQRLERILNLRVKVVSGMKDMALHVLGKK